MKFRIAAAVIAAIVLLPLCKKDAASVQKQYSLGQKDVVELSFDSLMDILPDNVCSEENVLKIAGALGYDKDEIVKYVNFEAARKVLMNDKT